MSINVFPLPAVEPVEKPSEVMTVAEVAKRMQRHPNTIRNWIAQDMADGGTRVPGARVGDTGTAAIIRAVFERAMRQGIEPERRPIQVAAGVTETISELRSMAARCTALADQLVDANRLSNDLEVVRHRRSG